LLQSSWHLLFGVDNLIIIWHNVIERVETDPGNQVKASCAPSMQSWTRRDPPRPPGAPSGLQVGCKQAAQHVIQVAALIIIIIIIIIIIKSNVIQVAAL
jgi:hypothetical protein